MDRLKVRRRTSRPSGSLDETVLGIVSAVRDLLPNTVLASYKYVFRCHCGNSLCTTRNSYYFYFL
jgi:hypothetical protein